MTGGAHDEHTFGHHAWYLGVFGVLCVLTALSVVFDVFDIRGRTTIGGINLVLAVLVLSVATAKALCVMMYFMHLKFEGRWKFLLLSPTVILAVGLPLALMPDVGAHYYLTDVPQNSAVVAGESEKSAQPSEGSPAEAGPAAEKHH